MTDLIYICASGRSGSTVVERILNSAPQVTAVGEIHALWRLPLDNLLCSCGKPVKGCSFWQQVLAAADMHAPDLARLRVLETEVVRNRYLIGLGFDLERIREDKRLAEFADLQKRLFRAIRQASGSEIVLDSSKAGPRAWVLAAFLGAKVLHIYRGAEDVIASWRRPKFDPSLNAPMKKPALSQAAIDWIKAEKAARSLMRKAPVSRLNYRAFLADPRAAMGRALEPIHAHLNEAIQWVDTRRVKPADTYHSVLGNPDRFNDGVIEIAAQSAAARGTFGWAQRGLIGALGKTLEKAYP
ncbi:MAG: sulfotransferase [Pseudomonadota bacterium]